MMLFIYNILIHLAGFLLKIISLFNKKIQLFVSGRKNVFELLSKNINANDKTIWFHCASLGEFEQGLPVIERVKERFSGYKIVVTFFSPSGYEIKKNTDVADVITYLPLDTKGNAKRFLNLIHPDLAIFIKYEFWANYLTELKKREIKTLLVSGVFRKNQMFFKFYGGFMRKRLHTFTHFFVQEATSKKLLNSIGFKNVTVSGDTRFDRVSQILKRDNSLDFIKEFKQNNLCFVAGSTWEIDEKILINFINNDKSDTKFIIAPHNIHPKNNQQLKNSINKKAILFSEKDKMSLSDYKVFILDTIGLLNKVYSYTDVAYVGGAMGTSGLHNILEPAVFGIPIIIGKNYNNFKEAKDLVEEKGVYSIKNQNEFNAVVNTLINNETLRIEAGNVNEKYVLKNRGSTLIITNYIHELFKT